MIAELNGAMMTSHAAAHDHLQEVLTLPEYYGRNLDALYDLLTEMGNGMEIRVLRSDLLRVQLGGYGDALLETLVEATENNPRIKLIIE